MKIKLGVNEHSPQTEELFRRMSIGDPRCKIPIGSRFIKILGEPKDVHMIGDKGSVAGSMQIGRIEAYLVHFDNDAEGILSFIAGEKIKEDV